MDQLLKYRKSIEDQHRIALATIEEKRYREEEKLFRLQEAQRACQRQLQSRQAEQTSNLSHAGSSLHISCLEALSQESYIQKKTLLELSEKAQKAREELIEASKSRKIVEKLHNKELERYKQNILEQERKYLDEIAANRFVRNGLQSYERDSSFT